MSLPPDLKARVLERVRAEPSPTRTELRRRNALVLGAAALAYLGLFLSAFGDAIGGASHRLLLSHHTSAN